MRSYKCLRVCGIAAVLVLLAYTPLMAESEASLGESFSLLPLDNDVCQNAQELVQDAAAVELDFFGVSGDQTYVHGCILSDSKDAWYRFTYLGGDIRLSVKEKYPQNPDAASAPTTIAIFADCLDAQAFLPCQSNAISLELDNVLALNCAVLELGVSYYVQISVFSPPAPTAIYDVGITTVSPGSCACTDATACNFNSLATLDDGSCAYGVSNDVCASASSIDELNTFFGVSNANACFSGPLSSCSSYSGHDLWYSFVYRGGAIDIRTQAGDVTDTWISLYGACGGSLIDCNDDTDESLAAVLSIECGVLTFGETYYIQTGAFDGEIGAFDLGVFSSGDFDQDGICDDLDTDDDNDGLLDTDELLYGSDALDPDSDNDGLSDGDEVHVYSTNPILYDSDWDGLSDRVEVEVSFTSPTNPDSDGDGCPDDQAVAGLCGNSCPTDIDGNGIVGVSDLLTVLSEFGLVCP